MEKKQRLFLILSLYFYSVFCFSQNDSSLVKFSDLNFKNDTEKDAFVNYNNTKNVKELFDLLYVSHDPSMRGNKTKAIQKIDDCVEFLKRTISEKSESKKVKIVYDYVHKEFLKVYKLKNSFIDIFETGEYNCVSASGLYAIIFSKLSIPYQIKETPSHVYLIAYPNSSKILIETTSPAKGYYQFTSSFISKYVTNLYNSKIISKEELESTSVNDLFNKYYFTSENISLLELAGIQFSNFAIYFIDDNDLVKAKEEIKNAYFLFESERHKYLLKATIMALIDKSGYDNLENVSNLSILCRFNNLKDKELSNDVITNEFSKIMNTQLIKNSDYDLFEKSFSKIINELKDSVLIGELTYEYNYELARLGYLNSKNQDYQLKHLIAAYKFNPMNANLRALIVATYERSIQNYNDSKSIIEESQVFLQSFDFFEDNDYFISVKLNCILDLAYKSFYYGELTKGDGYLKEFEVLLKKKDKQSPTASFVEKAYSQGASEYYRKGNYAKAKQLLKTGLIYAPNSFGLQQRLKQFN